MVRSLKLDQVHGGPALNLYSSAGKPRRVPVLTLDGPGAHAATGVADVSSALEPGSALLSLAQARVQRWTRQVDHQVKSPRTHPTWLYLAYCPYSPTKPYMPYKPRRLPHLHDHSRHTPLLRTPDQPVRARAAHHPGHPHSLLSLSLPPSLLLNTQRPSPHITPSPLIDSCSTQHRQDSPSRRPDSLSLATAPTL